jgi:hypothetical protein
MNASLSAFVVLTILATANVGALALVLFERLRWLQGIVHALASVVTIVSVGVRNYLSNEKAYELFIADRLAEREDLAREFAAWGPTLRMLGSVVLGTSVLGFAIRWARFRRWPSAVAAVWWLLVLLAWLALGQVRWTRMV